MDRQICQRACLISDCLAVSSWTFFEIFNGCKLEGFQGLNLLLVLGSHHHLNNPLYHIRRCRLDFNAKWPRDLSGSPGAVVDFCELVTSRSSSHYFTPAKVHRKRKGA